MARTSKKTTQYQPEVIPKIISGDHYLRDHKFEIHGRPKKGPVTWKRDGVIYEEEEAIALADAEASVD